MISLPNKINNIRGAKRIVLLLLVIILANNNIFAQNGDYRSRASGNWNANNVWQRWNGTVAKCNYLATAADGVITIRNGHTITLI